MAPAIGSPLSDQRLGGSSGVGSAPPRSKYDDGAPASEILREKGFPSSVVEAFKGRAISVAEFLELAESSAALARAQMELALEDPKLRMRVADVASFIREERARLPPPSSFVPAPAPPPPAWATPAAPATAAAQESEPALSEAPASSNSSPPVSPTSGPVAPRRAVGASVPPPWQPVESTDQKQ
ncbi:hypothetical protein HK405_004336 [Cladochytrium tenue]|nr:hypothetical protein HK405_004336 [Cladochytrium tenue]